MKQEESAHFGQKIRTESGVDKSSYNPAGAKEMLNGKEMPDKGLSHSMAAKPVYSETPAKPR
jgi:hypothetical protein